MISKQNGTRNEQEYKSFDDIQKDQRYRRINAVLNYDGYTKEQKEIMNKFYSYLQTTSFRLETMRSYVQAIKLLFMDFGKDISKVTKEDISKYLAEMSRKYKPKTISDKRKFLIVFFKWFYGKSKEEIPLIKDVKLSKEKGIKLPEEILSPEEVKRIIQVADNFRDKCIVSLLYESGARKGEFLKLKIKHVDIVNEEYGMLSIPKGKTDSRKIPIIYSIPHLNNWLNAHPRRDDNEAPLFVTLGSYLGQALGEDGLKVRIDILSERAGIKKNVYPHLFRHSRLTELAKVLREPELRVFAGWSADSSMVETYVHLSGQDVTNKLLANAGLMDYEEQKTEKDILKNVRCPRCKKLNPSDYKFCSCGFVLDISEANKLMLGKQNESDVRKELEAIKSKLESNEKYFDLLNRFFDKPEIRESFKGFVKNRL